MRTEPTTVLHVANFRARYSSNFVASIRALARQSRAVGLRHVMAFPNEAQDRDWIALLQEDEIGVRFVPRPELMTKCARSIANLVREEKAAIIHTHFSRQYEIEAALACLLLRGSRLKLVWHRHSSGPLQRQISTRVKDFIGNHVLAPNATLIAVSEQLRDVAVESGIVPSRIKVIPNGIDTLRATRVSTGRTERRNAWRIAPGVFTFLHFGWAPITKGVDLVLRACSQMEQRGLQFALVIVGQSETSRTVRGIFGRNMPLWLRVVEPIEEVGDFYAAADCMVSSSRWEGSPYTVGEAMVAGLPVVSTDIPGLRCASRSHGVKLVELDYANLGDGMAMALNADAGLRHKWSEANQEFILKNFSVECWTEQLIRVYTDLLNGTSASALGHKSFRLEEGPRQQEQEEQQEREGQPTHVR
jgi:glycosyltransferase involved in cell wall biosynthesis